MNEKPVSIFTDDFPLVSTEAELQALIAKHPSYDSYYVASGSLEDRKSRFEALYQKFYKYADKNFLAEVKKRFHQRTWEMYMGVCLMDKGIQLVQGKGSGPDLLVLSNEKKVWIECTACEKGTNDDRVPDMQYGVASFVPTDKMLVRMASSLKEKHERYEEYLSKKIIEADEPYIIALNIGALGYLDGPVPLILRTVFGVGHPTLSWPIEGGEAVSGWSTVIEVSKTNNSKVPMTFFFDKKHAGVSAVVYCKNTVLNHPETIGSDLVVVHNPNAKNPLPEALLSHFKTYRVDDRGNIAL